MTTPAPLLYDHPITAPTPPPWASAWGEDRFGVFATFRVGEVEQCMRWIPPGAFWMGSPDAEADRFGREARHLVTLTRGLWLADTPCTQELWEEVMSDNPSRFVSPRRPVEQVSWDDCQTFLEQLAERVQGLSPRLPTEAEWEHACRAGHDQATWLGDLEILGVANAPLLDSIAWYGGNSSVDFDLESGQEVVWSRTQYSMKVAGTREVKLKIANPWGLHDMLGNVYEWCSDWFGAYDLETLEDPQGPTSGSLRVIRGGSWGSDARGVRAAYRGWRDPGGRYGDVGFRLAQGPGRGAPERGREGASQESVRSGVRLGRSDL